MGIDVYLNWTGKPNQFTGNDDDFSETTLRRWAETNNARGVYIRESYFSRAYATHVFIPETFDTAPFTNRQMPNPYDGEEGIEVRRDDEGYIVGVHYPWRVLASRMEAVAKACQERYPGDPDLVQDHLADFMAFVETTRKLQEQGLDTWVENSY